MSSIIDSRQLRAFMCLAEKENFTLAAKELELTQSAISHSLKALEKDLKCRLFDRVGKKAMLTQAGEQLLIHGQRILSEMNSARNSIEHLEHWGQSRLRIGTSATVCEYLLPRILREFKRDHENSMITIQPGDTPEAVEALRQNRIDLALVLEPKRDSQFIFHPLFSDELRFIVAPKHPWALAGRALKEDIPRQNFILYQQKSYTWQMIEDYFRRNNQALNSVIQFGSMEAIKELVKLELGVGILAPWAARKELAKGSLVSFPLGVRKLKRHWGILHWKERRLSLAEENFISLCRKRIEKVVQ